MNPAPHPRLPDGVSTVTEHAVDCGGVPLYRNPRWERDHPWLEQGITGRGSAAPFDMGLFGAAPAGESARRWRALRQATRFARAVHARQVHGADLLRHQHTDAGLFIADDADGHATDTARVLLTVSVADCVPIALVAPTRRVVALLHAGWRGAAAGVLEMGVEMLARSFDVAPAELEVHLGPAICGDCFEVGPEVPAALGIDTVETAPGTPAAAGTTAVAGREVAGERAHVDLRAALAARALRRGVPAAAVTVSTHCTRCGGGEFFSHRGGAAERQVAILGVRDRRQP